MPILVYSPPAIVVISAVADLLRVMHKLRVSQGVTVLQAGWWWKKVRALAYAAWQGEQNNQWQRMCCRRGSRTTTGVRGLSHCHRRRADRVLSLSLRTNRRRRRFSAGAGDSHTRTQHTTCFLHFSRARVSRIGNKWLLSGIGKSLIFGFLSNKS